jgi:hypothetical protein
VKAIGLFEYGGPECRRSSATSQSAAPPARTCTAAAPRLEGRNDPGRVFDRTVGPDGYRAMADREAIKAMVTR